MLPLERVLRVGLTAALCGISACGSERETAAPVEEGTLSGPIATVVPLATYWELESDREWAPGSPIELSGGQSARLVPAAGDWRELRLSFDAARPSRVLASVREPGEPQPLWHGEWTIDATTSEQTIAGSPDTWNGKEVEVELAVPPDAFPVRLLDSQLDLGERLSSVILVVVDTLRTDAVVDAEGVVKLPHLAALAADGVSFRDCFSHASMTLPAHASLFSSQMPFESATLRNGDAVAEDLPLLTEHLGEMGFATLAAVSIGALKCAPGRGLSRGFERYMSQLWGIAWAERSFPWMVELLDELGPQRPAFLFLHFADPHDPYRNHGAEPVELQITLDGEELARPSLSANAEWESVVSLAPGKHRFEIEAPELFLLRNLTLEARGGSAKIEKSFVEGNVQERKKRMVVEAELMAEAATPVFMRVWATDTPGRDGALERYELEVEHVDEYVGRLMDELKARGLYDSSLIVFTSDHGEGMWDHDWLVHAEHLYDELLRVPLIIKPPRGYRGITQLRARKDELVRHVDITPTILDLLELPPLAGQRGVSLLEATERLLIAQTHKPIAKRDLICARDNEYKLIYDAGADSFEMYDVRADPGELEDIFDRAGDLRRSWQESLRAAAAVSLSAPDAEVDEETQRQLEALGY